MIKALMLFVFSVLCVLGGIFAAEKIMPDHARPSQFAGQLRVIKKRLENPLASKKELDKTFEETPQNLDGFIATMKTLDNKPGDVANVAKAQDDALDALDSSNETADQKAELDSTMITVRDYVAPNAIEHIKNLNAPESVKEAILKNYERTGILPVSVEEFSREPASQVK